MNTLVENPIDIEKIENEYKSFILNDDHPCIMAKTLFKMEKYHLKVYDSMEEISVLQKMVQDVTDYVDQYNFQRNSFESFIAVFPTNAFNDEISFEKALWKTLQTLSNLDSAEWDQKVSDDPEDLNFSFSLGGKAFYIVGLHPKSSRIARQSPYPTLVFNLHHQFDKLREIGTYHAVRDTIRKNDAKLQGHINPVLRDFGDDSETKQYSGRQVEANWKCPFHKS